jgi:hypothetical protein
VLAQAETLGGSLVVGPDRVADGNGIGRSAYPESRVICWMKIPPQEG